ncbi:right-handed parallel beta-helix repeat-containing protein, partial [bacterium]|nr:right-handed parallel beta-helix repeat-containing protein [bacterium]
MSSESSWAGRKRRLLLFLTVLCLSLFATGAWAQFTPGQPVYVDIEATGAETGENWDDALTSIPQALQVAEGNSLPQVWVAEGLYQDPFSLRSNIAVYGGFAGAEVVLAERDPEARLTIIDVSKAENGLPTSTAVSLGTSIGSARLDGFLVTGARNASGNGGGLWVNSFGTGNVIASCTFTGNYALRGGGMDVGVQQSLLVENCRIVGNEAEERGGGINMGGAGQLRLTDCVVANNRAGRGG